MKMLNMFIPLILISCHMGGSMGGGLLGGLESTSLNCKKEILVEKINEVLVTKPEFSVPMEYEKYCNWSKRGFDFLTYWTIYLPESDELIWVSVIDNPNQDESVTSISIRAQFDKSTNNWIYAADIDNQIGDNLTEMFRIQFLQNIDC